MRSFIKCFLGILAFGIISFAAHADGSWQGIPFGASIDEVLSRGIDMGIVRVENPKRIPAGPKAPNGLYDALRIENYEISGSKYEVSLVFDAKTDQLWGVVLKFAGKDARFEVQGLANALTEKYGQPVSRRGEGTALQEIIWHDKQARITLMYVPIVSHLQLNYEPPSHSIDNKL
ncbi:MAG: hypothetical protein ACYC0T_07025 [Ramlibacter sp.]